MQIRWSRAAAQDLFRIVEYIRRDNVPAAQRLAKTIYENVGLLSSFPYGGRQGRVAGTRELPVAFLPFLVVYRVIKTPLK